jgi:hypothetical protein
MSGASDQVSDGEVSIPCLQLHVPSPHAAAASPADSDDEVPVPHFTLHPALVSCDTDDGSLISRPSLPHIYSFTYLPYVRLQSAL